jgi:hypothetical protein
VAAISFPISFKFASNHSKLRLASVRPIGMQLAQLPDIEGHIGLAG